MCGIGAIISQTIEESKLDTLLSALQKELLHRGPDGEGIEKPAHGVGLVHTRLAFLDLSDRGAQPMWSSCRRYCLSFNGEIYNFKELRTLLEQEGQSFSTDSDTEVILYAYKHWGLEAFKKLRGMFAFILWDAEQQEAYLVRDPFGIKPLYYCKQQGGLIAASEVRALLRVCDEKPGLSSAGVYSFLLFGSLYEPLTLFEGIDQIPSGSFLRWKDGVSSLETYCSLPELVAGIEEVEAEGVPGVRAAVQESVRAHCLSDVPVGVLLSGGLDSSLVLHCAREAIPELHTFSIGFDIDGYNEADAAARTAKHYNTTHHTLVLTRDRFEALWESFFEAMDQPTIDGLNVYTVCTLLKEAGIKAALSGLGGDELFAGYPSFHRFAFVQRLASIGSLLPGTLPGALLTRFPAVYARYFDSICQTGHDVESYQGIRGLFPIQIARKLTAHVMRSYGSRFHELPPLKDLLILDPSPRDLALKVSMLELLGYMRNQLLRDADVFGMAHSIELRVPFVDIQLFRKLRSMKQSQVLARDKQILRTAFHDLPDHVLAGSKQGFIIPYREWITADMTQGLSRYLHELGFSKQSWYCRWSVYVLSRYLERHGYGSCG